MCYRMRVLYICIFGFKGASTSKVIGARKKMMKDVYDGQMILGDLVGLKLPDIRLTGEEKPRKNPTQEICPDWESNPDLLRGKRACYRLLHSGGIHTQCVDVYLRFQGSSTSQVIGARNEMIMDDHDGQMIFGDLGG